MSTVPIQLRTSYDLARPVESRRVRRASVHYGRTAYARDVDGERPLLEDRNWGGLPIYCAAPSGRPVPPRRILPQTQLLRRRSEVTATKAPDHHRQQRGFFVGHHRSRKRSDKPAAKFFGRRDQINTR